MGLKQATGYAGGHDYMAKIKALAVEEMTFREKFKGDSIEKVKKLRE